MTEGERMIFAALHALEEHRLTYRVPYEIDKQKYISTHAASYAAARLIEFRGIRYDDMHEHLAEVLREFRND